MDIAPATDGGGVAQSPGDDFHRLHDIAFGLQLCHKGLESRQGLGCEHSSGPGAKILGSEIFPADFAQISIHIRRPYRMPSPLVIQVLKQLVSGDILTFLDDPGQVAVVDVDEMFDAAFTTKSKLYRRAIAFDMVVAQ